MTPIRERVGRIWEGFFFHGCSPELLGTLRILLGFGMLPFHILQFKSLLTLDLSGRHFYFIDPMWYVSLFGIERLNPTLCLIAFVVLMASTISFAIGRYTRTSLIIMLLCVFYLKGMRDSISGDVHHRYLIPVNIFFFFALSRCGEIYSWDRARKDAKGIVTTIQEWEASWPIKAAQLYVCSFYFWSAIAKVRMSGLDWFGPDRIQNLLIGRAVRFGADEGFNFAYWLGSNETICSILGGATALFEFSFPLILLIHMTIPRLLFLIGVSGFHIANYFLASVKFLFVPVLFVLFFDVSIPARAFVERWVKRAA